MSTDFSRTLALLRKEKKLSQRAAAADLGISQALLSHYENGIREPGLAFVIRACDYYKVSADYLLGRTLSKDGTIIDAHQLYDVSEHKDNALRGSVFAQLNKKLMVNTISLIYGLLGQLGDRDLTRFVSDFFSCSLYLVFRCIYEINPKNQPKFFSISDSAFHHGAVEVSMMRTACDMQMEAELLRKNKNLAERLNILDQKTLQRSYPALYQSLFQILHNTSAMINRRLSVRNNKL